MAGFSKAIKSRLTSGKKSPSIPTRNSNPTSVAGSKNSNGPKGGSGKASVPANRDSANKKLKRPKRSARVNYSKLRG